MKVDLNSKENTKYGLSVLLCAIFLSGLTLLETWHNGYTLLPRNTKTVGTIYNVYKKASGNIRYEVFFIHKNDTFRTYNYQGNIKRNLSLHQKVEVVYNPAQIDRAVLNFPEELDWDTEIDTTKIAIPIVLIILFIFVFIKNRTAENP